MGEPHKIKTNIPSPFTRVFATGFYDGPTEGFLVHHAHQELFFFHLLDWDDGQDVRVFAVQVLHGVSVQDALNRFSPNVPESDPIWIVPESLDERTAQFIEAARRTARPVAIIATRSVLQTIEVWQDVDEDFSFKKQDWIASLGLSRSTEA